MKRFSEQLKKKSDSIRLRASERAELRDRLQSYIEYHPLPTEMKQAAPQAPAKREAIESQPFTTVSFNWPMLRGAFASMAVITLVAVPMVAERSAPGDVLYPVKVEFNEELRSKLALSPYQKIEWETTRLERRIAEAQVLASEGKLSEEVEAVVVAAVKEQSQKTKDEINKLRSTNEDDAAIAEIELASMLAVQSEVIENTVSKQQAAAKEGGDNTELSAGNALASVIAEESASADATQANAKPAFEKLVARVESETTSAYELFESVKDYASEEEVGSIERRLQDIDRKVSEALALVTPLAVDVEEGGAETVATDELPAVELDEAVSSTSEAVLETEAATNTPDLPVETATTADSVVTEEGADNDLSDEVEGDTEPEPATEEVVLTDEDREAARELMRSALTDVRKLITFMTNIDVRENVSIDDLVPVTPTSDERIGSLKQSLDELATAERTLGAELQAVSVSEKVTTAFADFSTELALTQASFATLDTDDITGLEVSVANMEAVVADIERLVLAAEAPNPEVSEEPVEAVEEADTTEAVEGESDIQTEAASGTPETAEPTE